MANTQYFSKEERMVTAGEYSKMQAVSKADALRQQQQAQERLKLAGSISGIETQALQETLQDDAFQDYYIPQNEQELQELASQLESENPEAQELLKKQAEAAGQSIEDYLNMSDPNIIEFLVRGAKLQCRKGSHLRKLNIPLCHGVYEGKNPMLHKLDCIVGDDWNIPTFGVCSSGSPELNTPKVMLQLEEYDPENYYESKGPTGENVKGKACSPAIIGTWQETYDLTRIVDNGQKDPGDKLKRSKDTSKGKPSLTMHSFLICKYGGLIEPLTSGQEHIPEAADYKTPEDQQKAEELQAKQEAEQAAKESAEQEAEQAQADSAEAAAANPYPIFDSLYVPETTVGGQKYGGATGQLSPELQGQIGELSERSGVDYYLLLATALHESGCSDNPAFESTDPFGAKGMMQVMKSTWDDAVTPGGINYKNGEDLREWAQAQGADFSNVRDSLANITVGTTLYREWNKLYPEDVKQAVNHYGEGSNVLGNFTISPEGKRVYKKGSEWALAPSCYEVLYFRDYLANEKGAETWYVGELYDINGNRLDK